MSNIKSFISIASIIIFICIYVGSNQSTEGKSSISVTATERGRVLTPVPDNRSQIQQSKKIEDERHARVQNLRTFLQAKNSPLMESAESFIEVASKYGLDWTLLPAIAGVESGFEKAGNTSDYNPFGYMCPGAPCVFDSYEQAIERVARTIATGRAYKRYQETRSIAVLAEIYNQASPDDWTWKIKSFQEKIR